MITLAILPRIITDLPNVREVQRTIDHALGKVQRGAKNERKCSGAIEAKRLRVPDLEKSRNSINTTEFY